MMEEEHILMMAAIIQALMTAEEPIHLTHTSIFTIHLVIMAAEQMILIIHHHTPLDILLQIMVAEST